MILTSNPWMPQTYLPHKPSPLTPRSANVNAGCLRFSSALMTPPNSAFPKSTSISPLSDEKPKPLHSTVPFSKRAIKTSPLERNRDNVRENRRQIFLNRVAHDREDRRWEARGEKLLRLDFLKDQKQWETEKARLAPQWTEGFLEDDEEDGYDLSVFSNQISGWSQNVSSQPAPVPPPSHQVHSCAKPEEEMEALLQQEDQELEALVSLMEDDEMELHPPSEISHYGSDDEDYDNLFWDYVSAGDRVKQDASMSTSYDLGQDSMDTSTG